MSTKDSRSGRSAAAAHPLMLDEQPVTESVDASVPESPATTAVRRRGRAGVHLKPQQMVAIGLAAAGVIALLVGWIGVSTKVEVWEQMPYLISGGFGGAILVGLGIAVYVAHEHAEDRRQRDVLARRVEHLETQLTTALTWRLDELEMALAAELDALAARLNLPAADRR